MSLARVVVKVGALARAWFLGKGNPKSGSLIMRILAGRKCLLIFTPYFSPNQDGPQKRSLRYPADEVSQIIEQVRAAEHP